MASSGDSSHGSPGKGSSSKWGSFLTQAITNVESRLDTILAEPSEALPPAQPRPTPSAVNLARPSSRDSSRGISPSPSGAKTSDRLQERLAKAVARKSSGDSSSRPSSRTGTPGPEDGPNNTSNLRSSVEIAASSPLTTNTSQIGEDAAENDTRTTHVNPTEEVSSAVTVAPTVKVIPTPGVEPISRSTIEPETHDLVDGQEAGLASNRNNHAQSLVPGQDNKSASEYDALLLREKANLEAAELRRQEEVHKFTERIDSLEGKLHYLSREASEAARKAASGAPANSLEKKIAEKDEQIALLMEEGQRLSKQEMKYLNGLKAARKRIAEMEKLAGESKKTHESTEKELAQISLRLRQSSDVEKRANDKLKALSSIENDLKSLRDDRDRDIATISDLKRQLSEANTKAEEAEKKVQTDALNIEKKLVVDLRDELSSLKIEKELAEDRSKTIQKDLTEQLASEQEKLRTVERDLKSELAVSLAKLIEIPLNG
jgi:hypothetical protein